MKNCTPENNFHENSLNVEEHLENLQNKINFLSKAVKSTMTEQLIVPPARVWDKIEKILDEQDNRRNNANTIIASSFGRISLIKRKKVYLATAAGLTVVAGLLWSVH